MGSVDDQEEDSERESGEQHGGKCLVGRRSASVPMQAGPHPRANPGESHLVSWHTFQMLTLTDSEAALRSGSVVAPSTRDVVVVVGPEAASYLHGQVSQNIEGLPVGGSAWTLLLEPAGRVTAWARVSRRNDEEFWIDVDAGSGEPMLARLERFKLRTQATFELRSDVVTAAVRGAESGSADDIRSTLATDTALAEQCVVADMAWSKSAGVDVLGADAATVSAHLNIPLGDAGVVELERIESGRPAMGREFAEKTIPAETGVVEQSADFTKGCYVGQELVARVDSRGNNTPRTIHPASMVSSQAPAAGSSLLLDGEAVGVVTSAAERTNGVVALVSVKRGVDVPAVLQVELDTGPADIAVEAVDWA